MENGKKEGKRQRRRERYKETDLPGVEGEEVEVSSCVGECSSGLLL